MQSDLVIPQGVPGQIGSVHGEAAPQALNLILLGPGQVGGSLLEQLSQWSSALEARLGIHLNLAVVANSRRMQLLGPEERADLPRDIQAMLAHARRFPGPVLIVDCTASEQVADDYAHWLGDGVHLVSANKHAGSGCLERYQAIQRAKSAGNVDYRCEATVGAGLPVIQTLRELQDSGDHLLSVSGCLSGTLSWLFNEYDGSRPFSALLHEARALGYTEPDPREDLSGMDVARKLLILAREAGHELTLDQVSLQGLVPPALRECDLATFLARCEALDPMIEAQWQAAQAANGQLVYIGQLCESGTASVCLDILPRSHPCAQLQGSDNLIQLRTAHYRDNPLVLRGPGAGPTVTAAGVFRDIIAVARQYRRVA